MGGPLKNKKEVLGRVYDTGDTFEKNLSTTDSSHLVR